MLEGAREALLEAILQSGKIISTLGLLLEYGDVSYYDKLIFEITLNLCNT